MSVRQERRSKRRDLTGTFKGVPIWASCSTGQRTHHPDFVKLWGEYLEEGMSCKHVAQTVGVSPQSVRKHYPDKVWNRAQILEHSFAVKALNKV